MTQSDVLKKAKKEIKEGNGIWNFSFWKGYCLAYDNFKNLVEGSTWGIIKPELIAYSNRFKGNILTN